MGSRNKKEDVNEFYVLKKSKQIIKKKENGLTYNWK